MRLRQEIRKQLPKLRSGKGPRGKSLCVMQAVDFLRNDGWGAQPQCVHPSLTSLAITVNDQVDDETRQKLYDLVPRLVDTAQFDDKELWVRLAVWSARRVLHLFEEKVPDDDRPRKAIEAAEAWLKEPSESARSAAWSARSAAHYDFFVEFLSEFERLTKHKPVAIPLERWQALCEVVR